MAEQASLGYFAIAIQDLKEKLAREDAADPKRVARRATADGRMLACACCGLMYPRGGWTCCAPASGQTWENWRKEWHQDCPNPKLEEAIPTGKARCPRHCGCERLQNGNLPIPTAMGRLPSKAAIDELRHELAAADPKNRTSSLPADVAPEPDPEFLKSEWE